MAVKVTIGADPEAVLWDIAAMRPIPACGKIGGTKRNPLHYNKLLNSGFTIQEDNVMVEFNIPPAKDLDQWCDYIGTAKAEVRDFVASKGPYELQYASQIKFPHKDLQSNQAMQFGCSPDFNAYADGAEFEPVDPATLADKQGALRFCGGHIHIGAKLQVPLFVAAAFADWFIGLDCISYDYQDRRRTLYGQPGRYRPTPYGFEYRTPSNVWLQTTDYTYRIGSCAFALGNFLSSHSLNAIRAIYQKVPWGAVRKAIADQDGGLRDQIYNYTNDQSLFAGTSEADEL